MRILSDLRGRGASVSLTAEGGISIKGGAPELIERARAHKDELIHALRLERIDGPLYEDSALRFKIDELGELIAIRKAQGKSVETCKLLLSIIWKTEEIGVDCSLQEAKDYLSKVSEQFLSLIDKIEGYMSGAELHAAAARHLSASRTNIAALA